MLVFWKQKLVLLAVPKTGTTAYAEALKTQASMIVSDPPELKHAPVYRYNRFFRPMFERMGASHMDVMAVVREPVSWLGSWYRYRQRPFLEGRATSTKDISFDRFVDAYCSGQRPPFADVGSQSKFIEPRPNGTCVSHLFQYEKQDEIVNFLESRLQCKMDLPTLNSSAKSRLELAPSTLAKFQRKCAADFETWERAGKTKA